METCIWILDEKLRGILRMEIHYFGVIAKPMKSVEGGYLPHDDTMIKFLRHPD